MVNLHLIKEKLYKNINFTDDELNYIINEKRIDILILYSQCNNIYKNTYEKSFLEKIWSSEIEEHEKINILENIISNPLFNPYEEYIFVLNILKWLMLNEHYDILDKYIKNTINQIIILVAYQIQKY
jgi:hypothetical protein